MQNVNELRTALSSLYDDLRAKKLEPNEARELTNIAGKMIASAAVQVKYAIARKEAPEIKFLEEK